MVTNLLTMESIGSGQFVRVREIRVVAPLQRKNQNLEAEDFWPTKHTNIHRNENLPMFSLKTFVYFVGRKNIPRQF